MRSLRIRIQVLRRRNWLNTWNKESKNTDKWCQEKFFLSGLSCAENLSEDSNRQTINTCYLSYNDGCFHFSARGRSLRFLGTTSDAVVDGWEIYLLFSVFSEWAVCTWKRVHYDILRSWSHGLPSNISKHKIRLQPPSGIHSSVHRFSPHFCCIHMRWVRFHGKI